MALFSFLVLLLTVNTTFSARIAGFCYIGGSQYMNMRNIMKELASRGHEVVMIVPSSQKIQPIDNVQQKIYQVPYKPGFHLSLMRLALEVNTLQMLKKGAELLTTMCEGALNSTEVVEQLRGFDLLVYDVLGSCGVLLGEHLGIPRVQILSAPNGPFSVQHMIPMPVSYVPQLFSCLTDKMTILERVMNGGVSFVGKVFYYFVVSRPMNALKLKYNITPERSFEEAVGDVELVLIRADFAVEYPQPLLPGNIMVGPLSAGEGKPLPPDLQDFVSNSGGHGFIIVSFGSNVASNLPSTLVDMLATAFGKLKQRVVWRLKGYIPSFLSSNIKPVDWLPQNDLLAHKDIKAFVSHCGHNGLYESAYHGVPVVAFPLFGDQHTNAKLAEHAGIGLTVHHKSCNAQELFETVERVIDDPRFKTKAMHISGLLKDRRRTPLQETCDWLEYVVRHGGARHLRAQVFNIPWYQYYLIDVMAFLVAITTSVVMVLRLICKCMCRACCKKSENKTKREYKTE